MLLFFLACLSEKGSEGLDVLGFNDNDPEPVIWELIVDSAHGLNRPRDLAFNPEVNGQLWLINHDDDSVVVIDDAGGESQSSQHLIDPYALHFMEKVSSISFWEKWDICHVSGKPKYL